MKDDAQIAYENLRENIERDTNSLRRSLDDMRWAIECADAEEPAWLRPALRRLRMIELLCVDDMI
jgi:hypothetical protein